jgi:hypothetical protein
MKGKRGFSYVLVFLLIIISVGIVQAAYPFGCDTNNMACCNDLGGLWCNEGTTGKCFGANTFHASEPARLCTIAVNQNVTLDYNWVNRIGLTNPKTYELNILSVQSGVVLQFYSTEYNSIMPKAVTAACADDEKFAGPSFPWGGNPVSKNAQTSSSGGRGGTGGTEKRWPRADFHGGGGGAGAGGGATGFSGGDGYVSGASYSGGAGSEQKGGNGNCAADGGITAKDKMINDFGGFNGGRAGGSVSINAKSIKNEGTISVNGDPGDSGLTGESHAGAGEGGYGGGPGAGGGGAGKIILTYNTISGAGTITANGGAGGGGGQGGNGKDCGNGAGAGGGGGGDGGIIGLIPLTEPAGTMAINCEAGVGGSFGGSLGTSIDDNSCGSGEAPTVALKGEDGKKGFCGITEMDPGGNGSIDYNRCSDGLDNDKDTQIDMNDPDCNSISTIWDASIWTDYSKKTGYLTSAKNISDAACGDDIGSCNLNPAAAPKGTCTKLPNVDYASFCYTFYGCGSGGVSCGCAANWYNMTSDRNEPYPFCLADNNNNCAFFYPYIYFLGGDFCEVLNETGCNKENSICYWTPPQEIPVPCETLWGESACNAQAANGCVWTSLPLGARDLGGLTSDNANLCLDSWSEASKTVAIPNTSYAWFKADGTVKSKDFSQYLILQADKTQFISNGAEWFQCAATGPTYTANGVGEYKTFKEKLALADGTYNCNDTVDSIFKDITQDTAAFISLCSDGMSPAACKLACDGENDCKGYCFSRTYKIGELIKTCGTNCAIKVGDPAPYSQLKDYFTTDSDFETSMCTISKLEPECPKVINPGGLNGGHGDYMDQVFCKQHQDICGAGTDSTSKTCKSLHEDTGYSYSGDDTKICDDTEYCDGGSFVQTADSDVNADKYCCYGQNAQCKVFETANCASVGGTVKPATCDNCGCTGITKGVNADCCIGGNWVDYSSIKINSNESFVCYKEEGNALFRECCGAAGCNNKDNNLNGYSSLSGNVYSMQGVPLHSIVNFDNPAVSGTGTDTSVRSYYNRQTNDTLGNLDVGFNNRYTYYSTNWSNFNYLEFDIMYNNIDVNYELRLIDSKDVICYYNISKYISVKKGPSRWQHVILDISNLNNCNSTVQFNIVKDINIAINGPNRTGINVLIDNFFLRTDGNSVNSKDLFCSGSWGDWVENLDGPNIYGDKGFYDQTEPELSAYGPYRDACEGISSFGWTGNVCCGDDTKSDNHGEYWVDSAGMCWNGTTVYNDMTVANALGLNSFMTEWTSSMNERSLLFYKNQLYSCNRSKSFYNDYSVSFNGKDKLGKLIDSITVVDFYSIRGNWICEEGNGWVNINNASKVRILASTLKNIAESQNADYTLMCGNFSKTVNLFGTMIPAEINQKTGYACVLRMGNNKFEEDGNEKVIIGLETLVPYVQYNSSVLNKFTVMTINSTDTCSNLSTDIDAGEFFERCAEDDNSNNEFYVYYNAPLKLMLLSDGKITAENVNNPGFLSFLQDAWTGFKNFFARLFGSGSNSNTVLDFDVNKFSKDFYISVQSGRTITGSMEEIGSNISLRVDYLGLKTNVSMLYFALKSNFPSAYAIYSASGIDNQSIYVTAPKSANVDWRLATSILRLNICEDCGDDVPGAVSVWDAISVDASDGTTDNSGTGGTSDGTSGGTSDGSKGGSGGPPAAPDVPVIDDGTSSGPPAAPDIPVIDDGASGPPAAPDVPVGDGSTTAPVANFVYTPTNPAVDDSISFTSTSYDSDGTIVVYQWYLDGTPTGDTASIGVNFGVAGTYTFTLNVTDNSGEWNAISKQVTVGALPPPPPPPAAP